MRLLCLGLLFDSASYFNVDHDSSKIENGCVLCAARAEDDRRCSADIAEALRRLHDLNRILLRGLDYEPIEVLDDVMRLIRKAEERFHHAPRRTASSETASQRSTPDLLCSEQCSSTSSNCSLQQRRMNSKRSEPTCGNSGASHRDIAVQVRAVMQQDS